MDSTIGGARARGDDRPGFGRQPIDPLVDGNRLAGGGIIAHGGPVTVAVDLLVRDRALDDEHVRRVELAIGSLMENAHEVVAAERSVEHLVVQVHPGQTWNQAEHDVLEAGLHGRGHRDRIAVAAHALGGPQDVHFVDAWRGGPRLSEHLPAGGHAKDLLSELGPKLTGWADRNAPIQYPPAIAQWQADAARLNGRLGALTRWGPSVAESVASARSRADASSRQTRSTRDALILIV